MEDLISRIFKEKAIIKYKINEKILGGIKISSEEFVIDASVFSVIKQLEAFYKNLKLEDVHYEN